MKFGGTSVGNAKNMDKVLDIARSMVVQPVVLVSSAMTKVTDALIKIAEQAAANQGSELQVTLDGLRELHFNTIRELLGDDHAAGAAALEVLFAELSSLSRGLLLIREVSSRSRDALLSFGERLSTVILYQRAVQRGMKARLLDARTVIKTDEQFGSAHIIKDATYQAISRELGLAPGELVITQGFIGSTLKGVTSTLGRGGSDYSGTIFGAALQASEVQIWTDVDGIMTTDPRIVPEARVIRSISYTEAAELSFFGAKVIHPSTIQPAVELGIPVWVKNTMNPAAIGTEIIPETNGSGLLAIAGKKGISVVTVRSSRMLNAYGFLRSMFQVFEEHKVSVDLIATSEVSVSVTVDDPTHLKQVIHDIATFAEVEVEHDQAIVCLVGKQLWKDAAFVGRAFSALEGIPLRMVSLGSSDVNLSLVVSKHDMEQAIKKLHNSLFGR